jgi:Transposase zinc-binding domain/Putative transposase
MKVMSAIERCRTAALGGHVARCEDCAHTVIAYNSCRNRHCPKCQGAAAQQWLAEREAELLPVGYFHVVFTLPRPIADIAYHNKAVIYDLLFKASSETVLTIAADPKHLGAHIGITAVLHTWGSTMTHHPHIHMIVPGGGVALDGKRWLSCRPRFLPEPSAGVPYPSPTTPINWGEMDQTWTGRGGLCRSRSVSGQRNWFCALAASFIACARSRLARARGRGFARERSNAESI